MTTLIVLACGWVMGMVTRPILDLAVAWLDGDDAATPRTTDVRGRLDSLPPVIK